jgi:tetratricopeptide (TPR) repeat protein
MSSSSNTCSSFDHPQVNNGSVIIKPSRSLRHHLRFFGRKKHYYKYSSNSKYSGGTAISTVCSLEEHHQLGGVDHPTISTTNGTEAILDPQQESQYLYSQGVQQYAQGQAREATESLTQALSIADGLELEPKILWTLVSFHAQQEEFEQAATYVTVLKPLLAKIQEAWIQQEASLPLLSLLMETKLWNMAWTMSQYLPQKDTLDPTVLARIHFEVACSCLATTTTTTTSSTEQALPHLKEALELVQDRDEPLKQAILQNMVHAHAAEEEWDEALSFQESYMESIRGGEGEEENPIELAQGQYDAAQLYLAMEEYDDALSCLNGGLLLVPSKHGLTTKMLQAKAHVLLQLGNVDESLAVYKSLCPKLKQPSDVAKIYYTMACICRKHGRHDESLAFFKSELKVTKSAPLGKQHHVEATCRIYHDMARIHDECLGDYEASLKYYAKALKVQQRALKKCTNPVDEKELLGQILETQQCMGRIHYKRGEFTQALNVSFQENVAV